MGSADRNVRNTAWQRLRPYRAKNAGALAERIGTRLKSSDNASFQTLAAWGLLQDFGEGGAALVLEAAMQRSDDPRFVGSLRAAVDTLRDANAKAALERRIAAALKTAESPFLDVFERGARP